MGSDGCMAESYIFKLIIYVCTIIEIVTKGNLNAIDVVIFLIILGIDVLIEKFKPRFIVIILQGVLIAIAIYLNMNFMPLLGIATFNLIFSSLYYYLPIPFIPLIFVDFRNLNFLFLVGSISVLYALFLKKHKERESMYIGYLDKERRLRYEIEKTKAQLLNSQKEISRITEIRERNRIARDIHDNIGHRIAGILMQLQVTEKLYQRKDPKASDYIKKSINELAESLDLIRDTVHNIKPREEYGVELIERIISEYRFCKVNIKYIGNVNEIPVGIMENLVTNIKEALTNASKHSRADEIYIEVSCNEKFVRLYIKDNGVGAKKYKDGLGLSGMKERVKNMGGSIAISGEEGFLIVCMIPINQEARGVLI